MARDALGRLQEARELDKIADSIKARDPQNARRIQAAANKKRASAAKQLTRKPKKKTSIPKVFGR